MKKIGILGCTGSIGKTTLRVIDDDSTKKVELLANNNNLEELKVLIRKYQPSIAICVDKNYLYKDGKEYTVDSGVLADESIYKECDIVVNGIVGLAGLAPTLAVIRSGAVLATANKESFVCAGAIINKEKEKYKASIFPVDSEHSAVWQLIDGRKDIKDIVITASGGAFRDRSREELVYSTAEEALNHPNWIMGKKVTIDCATLMNKGMEIIEAKHLFGRIPTVVGHRESQVHALVQYADGTFNANISRPDMYVPICYALNYPDIKTTTVEELHLEELSLNFFRLDEEKFPCLSIAKKVSTMGDIAGCVMNAADEVLVHRYMHGDIGFYDISTGIERALAKFGRKGDFSTIGEVFCMDKAVREYTSSMSFGGKK